MICAVIPTYNNARTLSDVILRTARHIRDIIVVVDGSTDDTLQVLSSLDEPVTVVTLDRNYGKGYALRQGFRKAVEMGFTHALTIDSDGQHFPEDIPALLAVSRRQPEAFVVGNRNIAADNMPRRNTFANRFSNFWFAVQTGVRLPDTQTGMRVYPLDRLHGLSLMTSRYEAELELLVVAAWAGERIVSVPVRVYYPPEGERVSHFRPAYDFARISLLNTVLCFAALFYGMPRRCWHSVSRSVMLSLFPLIGAVCALQAADRLPHHVDGNRRLYAYPADSATNTGMAVIVCPGGSYSWLDMPVEGIGVAQWLQSQGINAFVLRYRVANVSAYIFGYRVLGLGNVYPRMLEDAEDALRWVYTHADEYGIDTTAIGVMGFSAGGHLSMASWLYNRTPYKPRFLCPVYPVVSMSRPVSHKRSRRGALGVWGQFRQPMRDSLSLERHITPDCPPVFLVNCKDDPVVDYRNSELLDSALTANNVPHKYIQYQTGGHGFGASDTKGTEECRQWKQEWLRWISSLNP